MHTPQQPSHQTPDPYSTVIRSNPAGLATPGGGGALGSSSGGLTPLVAPNRTVPNSFSAFMPPSIVGGGLSFPSGRQPAISTANNLFASRISGGPAVSGGLTPRSGGLSAFNPPSVGLSSVIDAVGLSRQHSVQSSSHKFGDAAGLDLGSNVTPAGSTHFAPRTPLSLTAARLDEQPMSSATTSTIPTPQLQNIVCTVDLACKLELKQIALKSRNAEYNPKRFAAVIMRIREPRTTALIFSSGKMVCTGAKSEESARNAARKYARIIQKLNFEAKFKDFKVQNMVASCDVGFPLRLEGLTVSHSQFSTYEPELFPGLIYRMTKPKIVLLLFVSGKVVLTGAKEREEIFEAFRNIYPVLKGFRKITTN